MIMTKVSSDIARRRPAVDAACGADAADDGVGDQIRRERTNVRQRHVWPLEPRG